MQGRGLGKEELQEALGGGRGLRKAGREADVIRGGAQRRRGLKGRKGSQGRDQVYLLLSSPSVTVRVPAAFTTTVITSRPCHSLPTPLAPASRLSCSIRVSGAEAPPLPRELLVTRTRLFIKWAQRVWGKRQLGVTGGEGAHRWPLLQEAGETPRHDCRRPGGPWGPLQR